MTMLTLIGDNGRVIHQWNYHLNVDDELIIRKFFALLTAEENPELDAVVTETVRQIMENENAKPG